MEPPTNHALPMATLDLVAGDPTVEPVGETIGPCQDLESGQPIEAIPDPRLGMDAVQ